MRKLEWRTIGLVVLWALIIILLYNLPTQAQDSQPYVCRDTTVESPRYEFHNLPQSWQDGTEVYWSLSNGGGFVEGVLVLDGLLEYEDNAQGIVAGMALVGSTDYSFELRGDASTLDCEPIPEPTSEPIPVVQIVMSTGRTCVVKYPEIILVCNG